MFFLLLTVLNHSGTVYASGINSGGLDGKKLLIEKSEPEKTVTSYQEELSNLKKKYEALDNRLNSLGRQADITQEITKLNESLSKVPNAIEDASSGFFSSILNWIFQVIGIVVGAGVAIYVLQQQSQSSWEQFQENQLALQQTAEERSRESWKQLLYSLGVQEDLQNERLQREAEAKLTENVKVQEALRIGLDIYVGVLSDYSDLAVSKIRTISEKPEEAKESLSSIELPTLPPGLWENLHSYTNVIGSSSSVAILTSHLYDFGRHYSELKKQNVLASLEAAGQYDEEPKEKELEKAIQLLKEYKVEIGKYFEEVQAICANQSL